MNESIMIKLWYDFTSPNAKYECIHNVLDYRVSESTLDITTAGTSPNELVRFNNLLLFSEYRFHLDHIVRACIIHHNADRVWVNQNTMDVALVVYNRSRTKIKTIFKKYRDQLMPENVSLPNHIMFAGKKGDGHIIDIYNKNYVLSEVTAMGYMLGNGTL